MAMVSDWKNRALVEETVGIGPLSGEVPGAPAASGI